MKTTNGPTRSRGVCDVEFEGLNVKLTRKGASFLAATIIQASINENEDELSPTRLYSGTLKLNLGNDYKTVIDFFFEKVSNHSTLSHQSRGYVLRKDKYQERMIDGDYVGLLGWLRSILPSKVHGMTELEVISWAQSVLSENVRIELTPLAAEFERNLFDVETKRKIGYIKKGRRYSGIQHHSKANLKGGFKVVDQVATNLSSLGVLTPDAEKQKFIEFIQRGKPYEEIGAFTGLSRDSVKKRINAALNVPEAWFIESRHPVIKRLCELFPLTTRSFASKLYDHGAAKITTTFFSRIEASIWISALYQLEKEGIGVGQIHDSIICRRMDTERVTEIVQQCAKKAIGYNVALSVTDSEEEAEKARAKLLSREIRA